MGSPSLIVQYTRAQAKLTERVQTQKRFNRYLRFLAGPPNSAGALFAGTGSNRSHRKKEEKCPEVTFSRQVASRTKAQVPPKQTATIIIIIVTHFTRDLLSTQCTRFFHAKKESV